MTNALHVALGKLIQQAVCVADMVEGNRLSTKALDAER